MFNRTTSLLFGMAIAGVAAAGVFRVLAGAIAGGLAAAIVGILGGG